LPRCRKLGSVSRVNAPKRIRVVAFPMKVNEPVEGSGDVNDVGGTVD
jgi:hypothetical protein